MGLLCLDITPRGIILSSDSQDIQLLNNSFRIINRRHLYKQKIITVNLNNFHGLLGYVGTEKIGSTETLGWLKTKIAAIGNRNTSLYTFCTSLATSLSDDWNRRICKQGLWLFITGYEGQQERFWYINNIAATDSRTGLYTGIGQDFKAVDDLDGNYIKKYIEHGYTKRHVLNTTLLNFRNGVLIPFIGIYDKFNDMLQDLYKTKDPGFKRPTSLKDFAFIAKQRFEFVKRLYSKKHGIYKNHPPIGGDIIVYTIDRKHHIYKCNKNNYLKVA
jgi:hypothetical protein